MTAIARYVFINIHYDDFKAITEIIIYCTTYGTSSNSHQRFNDPA